MTKSETQKRLTFYRFCIFLWFLFIIHPRFMCRQYTKGSEKVQLYYDLPWFARICSLRARIERFWSSGSIFICSWVNCNTCWIKASFSRSCVWPPPIAPGGPPIAADWGGGWEWRGRGSTCGCCFTGATTIRDLQSAQIKHSDIPGCCICCGGILLSTGHDLFTATGSIGALNVQLCIIYRGGPHMVAIIFTTGTKYACNLGSARDLSMLAMIITMGT